AQHVEGREARGVSRPTALARRGGRALAGTAPGALPSAATLAGVLAVALAVALGPSLASLTTAPLAAGPLAATVRAVHCSPRLEPGARRAPRAQSAAAIALLPTGCTSPSTTAPPPVPTSTASLRTSSSPGARCESSLGRTGPRPRR